MFLFNILQMVSSHWHILEQLFVDDADNNGDNNNIISNNNSNDNNKNTAATSSASVEHHEMLDNEPEPSCGVPC